MATLRLRPIEPGDSLPLRAKDVEAIELAGFTEANALAHSAKISTESWMVELNGEPVAAWGYGSHGLVGTSAYGWLLTTEEAARHPLLFLRFSHRAVTYVMHRFLRFEVQVQKSHPTSQMWLAWLGFVPISEDAEFYTLEKVR